MNKRELGKVYEEKTCQELVKEGYKILERNYYCPLGEIDIIARDEQNIIFLEVKARKSNRYGHPAFAVDYYKQQHIIRTSFWFVKERGLQGHNFRYDVVCWENEKYSHYKGAFGVNG